MRSLRNLTGISKIFKYQDFSENEPEPPKEDRPSPDTPYLIFKEEPREDHAAEPAGKKPAPVREVTREEALLKEAEAEAERILGRARAEAQEIVDHAAEEAKTIWAEAKRAGHGEGYEQGVLEGKTYGEEQLLQAMDEKYKRFFTAIDAACENIDFQKQEILNQHIKDLSDLSVAIAEKVVHVALESCGEVIRRMIVSAAGPAIDKQWAKVMISIEDAERMKEDGIDIRKALNAISGRIDLMIVDDAPQGACVIEFPDQVLDAGAATQLRNIKELVRNAEKE